MAGRTEWGACCCWRGRTRTAGYRSVPPAAGMALHCTHYSLLLKLIYHDMTNVVSQSQGILVPCLQD